MSRYDAPCEHLTGTEVCGQSPTRLYLTGRKCVNHTPAALAGHPEPRPDPSRIILPPTPASASRVVDNRAIASGKRRSSPDRYREAQAAVNGP